MAQVREQRASCRCELSLRKLMISKKAGSKLLQLGVHLLELASDLFEIELLGIIEVFPEAHFQLRQGAQRFLGLPALAP